MENDRLVVIGLNGLLIRCDTAVVEFRLKRELILILLMSYGKVICDKRLIQKEVLLKINPIACR